MARRVNLRAPVSYDPISGSLLTGRQTADGETYRVVAAEPLAALSPALLSRVRNISAKDRSALTEFLQLPPGIPVSVGQLARRVVPARASEYQKALALQEFFHRAPFVYTLGPPQGDNSTSALVSFLFRTHAGYCQQYAGAYAVLARLAGLPARVAVGFSTGTPIGPHAWQVLGLDAHAWPEVWFPSVGWVPFEPTPTFRIPGAPQDIGATAGPQPGSRTPAPTPVPDATSPASPAARGGVGHLARPRRAGGDAGGRLLENLLLVVISLVAALVAWAVLVRTGELVRRRRRRRRLVRGVFFNALPTAAWEQETALARRRRLRPTSDETEALGWLLVSWEEVSEELGRSGLARRAAETPAEWARRASEALGRRGALSSQEQNALVEVGEALSHAVYGRWRPGAAQVRTLHETCNQVSRRAREVLQWRQRLRRYLDPRTAWRSVAGPPLPER
jgi:transglutaminase-like putative cysteine protease